MAYQFEWDSGNLSKLELVRKSGRLIYREEIESVFTDPNRLINKSYLDPISGEQRYIAIGNSNQNQVLSVVFVVRNGKIRVFNVWRTKGAKLKTYHEKRTN